MPSTLGFVLIYEQTTLRRRTHSSIVTGTIFSVFRLPEYQHVKFPAAPLRTRRQSHSPTPQQRGAHSITALLAHSYSRPRWSTPPTPTPTLPLTFSHLMPSLRTGCLVLIFTTLLVLLAKDDLNASTMFGGRLVVLSEKARTRVTIVVLQSRETSRDSSAHHHLGFPNRLVGAYIAPGQPSCSLCAP